MRVGDFSSECVVEKCGVFLTDLGYDHLKFGLTGSLSKKGGGQVYSLSILMYSVRVDNSDCAVPGEDGGAMPTLGRDRRNDEGPPAVKKRDMEIQRESDFTHDS